MYFNVLSILYILKPLQNKNGQKKISRCAASCKIGTENCAPGKIFVPSYFVTTLVYIFLFSVMSTNELRNMIRQSDVEGLEECILDGHGSKLLGENAADNKIRAFIKAVPSYLVKTSCFLLFSN